LANSRGGRTCDIEPTTAGPDYDELLDASLTNDVAFHGHIAAHREAGVACTVLAAAARDTAAGWDRRAATFTVALVIFGLAGFLLALAADRGREPSAARWLLRMGVAGAVVGGLVALSVPAFEVADGRELGTDEILGFASHVAAGRTSMETGECEAAVQHLDEALAAFDGHGPAFASRAEARTCSDEDWLISAEIEPDHVRPAIRDWETARRLGVSDPSGVAQLAWLHLLDALQQPSRGNSALDRATAMNADALEAVEAHGLPSVHVARFNVALAHLASGDVEAERRYEDALGCLEGTRDCAGGWIHDAGLRRLYKLMALADLELLEESTPSDLDHYRALIAGGGEGTGALDRGEAPTGQWSLDVFPQELQVTTGSPDTVPPVSIVWYYRPSGEE
ncbi:MAG: hypothetical protein ACRD08_17015, partial [Acidimicrobiales bacterium]